MGGTLDGIIPGNRFIEGNAPPCIASPCQNTIHHIAFSTFPSLCKRDCKTRDEPRWPPKMYHVWPVENVPGIGGHLKVYHP
jgi:hypothetical protein